MLECDGPIQVRPCKGRNGCVLFSVMINEYKGKTHAKVSDCQASQACKGKTDAKIFDCQASQAGNSGDCLGFTKPGTLVIVSLDNVIFNEC